MIRNEALCVSKLHLFPKIPLIIFYHMMNFQINQEVAPNLRGFLESYKW